MNTAKLVNSALTGGGLIYPENLNVIIGSEDHGYPKGYVLDANASLSLSGSSSSTGNSQNSNLGFKAINYKFEKVLNNKDVNLNNISLTSSEFDRKNLLLLEENDKVDNYPISGGSNIVIGGYNVITGYDSVVVGKSIFTKGIFNIFNSIQTMIPIVKNAQNKVEIVAREGSQIMELINNGLLYIFPNLTYKNNTISNIAVVDKDPVKITDYTRVSPEIIQINHPELQNLYNSDKLITVGIYGDTTNTIASGSLIQTIDAKRSISVGYCLKNEQTDGKYPNTYQLFGTLNTVKNNFEFACGSRNVSTKTSDFSTRFSIGVGLAPNDYRNGFEVGYKKVGTTFEPNVYVLGIGNYNGKNAADSNVKSLQQVISEIQNNSSSTTQPVVDNGPWDVDITSKFVKGNVNISPSAMWTINQGYKRVYLETKLNQGDIIKIPNTIRMYIGWKDASGQFGMANWTQAGTTYTATVDGDYVILLDTPSANNPGIEPATLNSFGKVMLHTSNVAYKPNAGGSQPSSTTQAVVLPKDHTKDDRVMRGIAHQGYHTTERANSLAAFRAAAKEGWRYVETDTYMTSDGKFIVSHDPYLPIGWTNGTTTTTQGSYKYEDHTLADILAFHGPNNEKTDTLEEFCKTCKECGLHPYIELKQAKMYQNNTIDAGNSTYENKPYAYKILMIASLNGLRGNATFISSTPYTLRLMAQYDQTYRYGIVYFDDIAFTDVKWMDVYNKINEFWQDSKAKNAYQFIDVNISKLKNATNIDNICENLIGLNCGLEVWTAKTEADLEGLHPYVTGVTSDNIHAGEILAKKI